MCARFLEDVVQIEGDTGQVAEVFEQGEEREEDGHGRQHDADDPGRCQIHAIDEQSAEPPGHADGGGGILQKRIDLPQKKHWQSSGMGCWRR